MSFIVKYKIKLKKSPLYRIYQLGLAIAILAVIKLRKYVLNKQCLIYTAITVPMCLIWTILLCNYDNTPPWFFYDHTLILGGWEISIFGSKFVVEDILFFTVGQILGFLMLNLFLSKQKEWVYDDKWENIKILYLGLMIIIFVGAAIFFDYISLVNMIFFVPGLILWMICFNYINLKTFLKYVFLMSLIVYAYDFFHVVFLPFAMEFIGVENSDSYSLWMYKHLGSSSKVYAARLWLWYKEPIGMVIGFPMSGMFFQMGLMTLLKRKYGDS